MEKRINVLKQARENIGKAQVKQKRTMISDPLCWYIPWFWEGYDKKEKKGGKLDWTAPFEIGSGLYQLSYYNNPKLPIPRVNGVHLKKYNQPSKSPVSLL